MAGVPGLMKALGEIGDAYNEKLEAGVKSGALLVMNMAKQLAPYKTGNLESSIHVEMTERSASKVTAQVGTDVEYAAVQEFGGGNNIPPHPYLRPPLDHLSDEIIREIGEALK